MKKVMKYMMVLLAVGFMGLSVHASATPEVMTAAAAATEVVEADIDLGESLMKFVEQSGISGIIADWRVLVMLIISCVLLYLAIVKKFEPLLLLPIAFGMLLSNLPMFANSGAIMMHPEYFTDTKYMIDGHLDIQMILSNGGLLDLLYLGVKLGIYPPLIFLGIGCMTDFAPLIANPKSIILGAAAQLGVFLTFSKLTFNAFFSLAVRGVSCVDNCCFHSLFSFLICL